MTVNCLDNPRFLIAGQSLYLPRLPAQTGGRDDSGSGGGGGGGGGSGPVPTPANNDDNDDDDGDDDD